MNVFNRAIVVVIALIVLIGSVLTVLVTTEAADPDVLFSGWFESQFEEAADASGADAAGIVIASIAIGLAMIILLMYELAALHRPVLLLLSATEEGTATIDRDSICELAEHTALSVRNVDRARCKIARDGAGPLVISCRVSLEMGANLPETSNGLRSKIKSTVEELTGMTVQEMNLKSKYNSGRAKHMALH